MDPISERFLSAVHSQLATILTANGYKTNAGAKALRSAQTVEAVPAVVLWEGDESPIDQTDGRSATAISLAFSVEGFVDADQAETGSQLTLIKADIKRCVMGWYGSGAALDSSASRTNKSFGEITYLGAVPYPRKDGATDEGVSVRFAIRFFEKVGDPYADT